ncbi:hypothetical protein [Occallatibacter riparius]|uniref:Uncharacterized protein n=1 Tax=Occallatibacter riparius TaxID=1002689 RepID=A0A9J7BQH5_9BACT|nr:hypothetical protein [Occallatibacter riparius]UWZ83190.1 hypothetical protein MOP44_21795 [Occallatibacter riparius]
MKHDPQHPNADSGVNDKSVMQNIAESNEIGVDLLITDCGMALTLLDLAETTDVLESRSRRIGEAHHAYNTIVHFLERLSPTVEQGEELHKGLEKLKARLQTAGVSI